VFCCVFGVCKDLAANPPPSQEGWHLELDDPSDPLTYKGVVFNEMKGVYSSPDSMFYRTVQQVCDGFFSGWGGGVISLQHQVIVLQDCAAGVCFVGGPGTFV
jgi:hypothetical protein